MSNTSKKDAEQLKDQEASRVTRDPAEGGEDTVEEALSKISAQAPEEQSAPVRKREAA